MVCHLVASRLQQNFRPFVDSPEFPSAGWMDNLVTTELQLEILPCWTAQRHEPDAHHYPEEEKSEVTPPRRALLDGGWNRRRLRHLQW